MLRSLAGMPADVTLCRMVTKLPPGLFITGTDTGVGKTYVTARIAAAAVADGKRVGVYKPASSGCETIAQARDSVEPARLVCDDANALWIAAGKPGELNNVCPQRFRAPLAPHLAARAEGRVVDPERLRSGIDYWRQRSDLVLVEGVGGLMSPISDDDYVADLAYEWGYPLIVVAPNVIGVINQTLQTLITAAAFQEGLPVAGVVLNQTTQPDADTDPSILSNRQELEQRCVPPILAQLGWEQLDFDPGIDWYSLAAVA